MSTRYKNIGLITIGLLLTTLFLIPLGLPKTFQVERETRIQQPPIVVFRQISNLQTWTQWSPWYTKEPEAKIEFSGTPGVVGSFTRWHGKEIGSGVQTLTKVIEPEYMETALEFSSPQESIATGYWTVSEDGDGGSVVIWGIKGELGYPIERYFGLFFDGMIGNDFERGLDALKSLLEDKN